MILESLSDIDKAIHKLGKNSLSDSEMDIIAALYNGKRGEWKWLGKFFYWYYPAHPAAIGLIYRLFFS